MCPVEAPGPRRALLAASMSGRWGEKGRPAWADGVVYHLCFLRGLWSLRSRQAARSGCHDTSTSSSESCHRISRLRLRATTSSRSLLVLHSLRSLRTARSGRREPSTASSDSRHRISRLRLRATTSSLAVRPIWRLRPMFAGGGGASEMALTPDVHLGFAVRPRERLRRMCAWG